MIYLPDQGEIHAAVCRWCGGARTALAVTMFDDAGVRAWTCLHACIRCDTDQHGGGYGPPVFMAEWNERTN